MCFLSCGIKILQVGMLVVLLVSRLAYQSAHQLVSLSQTSYILEIDFFVGTLENESYYAT